MAHNITSASVLGAAPTGVAHDRADSSPGAATMPPATPVAAAKVRKPRRPRCEACQFARDILADTEEAHRVRCTHRAVTK